MEENERVQSLISLAEQALRISKEEGVELFTERTGAYLDALEQWQTQIKGQNPLVDPSPLNAEERQSLRSLIERLGELHQELMTRAGAEKEEVGQQIGEVHKRAAGLRKYIDTAPSRITVAGKRKG